MTDETTRLAPPDALLHLNRVLRAVRNVNQLIVREKDPQALIQQACDLLVGTRGYRAAWIVLTPDGEAPGKAAGAGFGRAFAHWAHEALRGLEPSCWDKSRLTRDGLAVLRHDADCQGCALQLTCAGSGAMVASLLHDRILVGFLGVSTPPEIDLNDDERALVLEVAGDVAFALNAINREVRWREATERFRVGFERGAVGQALISLDGRFLRVNDALSRMLGTSSADLEGRPLTDVTPPEDPDIGASARQNLLSGRDTIRFEKRYVAKGGERVWADVSLALVRDPERTPQYFVATFVDITEQKLAEVALQQKERELRALVEHLPSAIVVHAPDTSILLSNPMASTLLGLTDDQMRGKTAPDQAWCFVREDGTPMPLDEYPINRVLSAGEPLSGLVVGVCRPDRAETTWVLCNAYPVRDAEGHLQHAVVTFVDVTAIRRAEVERLALQAQLVQSQRLESIGTLAAGVAHEINNPLNIVMNFGQLILDDRAVVGESREFATAIVRESERIAGIVRNLLAFSRNEKVAHSPADPGDLVTKTLALVQASFRKDSIVLASEIPAGLPKVRCRSQQIQQVVMNLLTNARDALNARFPGASPDKVIRIAVQPFERDGLAWVRVTVEDHGVGVAPEVVPRVFDPFFTTKPRDKGTGLGLSISYGIVKEHGGELWFESEPGVGSRFHVDLKVNNGGSSVPAMLPDPKEA